MKRLNTVKNCLHLFGVYETYDSINLILEFIQGGELLKKISEKMHFKNNDAKHLMKNILETIAEIHSRHIIHRDLKPENILLTNSEDLTSIIIADFGLATYD